MVVVDEAFRILIFSAGAEAVFGYRASEVLGRGLDQLIPEHLRVAHRLQVAAFVEGPVASLVMNQREPILGRRKTGATFPAEVAVSKQQTPDGLIFTAIVRDITERRRDEAAMREAAVQARESSLVKSAFLATMSHEIRTPLNGVLAIAQVMAMDELSPLQRDRLKVIKESGEALLAILNDVLDISKIEAGKLDLEEGAFDLGALLRGTEATFTALANRKGLSFSFDIERALGTYIGDATRLRQILYNLISNALKFTETGGVRVSADYADGALRIAVSDTGIGIAPDVLSTLFNVFVQADATTTRRFGGTGLGLAISRQLAEMMGGTIDVRSTPGESSTFEVILPIHRDGAGAAPVQETSAPNLADAVGARVLAAEDNLTNQLVLKTVLHQVGIQPVLVGNGLAAVEAWKADDFDVVLMDVQMPELDGVAATRRIRAEEERLQRQRTPIIGLTANAMTHQTREYLEAGMDMVVTKPIKVAELLEALSSVLPTT